MAELKGFTASEKAKDRRLRKQYNITLEAQNVQREKQKNCCAICGKSFEKYMCFQDHEHKCCPRRLTAYCGKCCRGLLCFTCNKFVVGVFERMNIPLQPFIDYIVYWKAELTKRGCYEKKETTVRRIPKK